MNTIETKIKSTAEGYRPELSLLSNFLHWYYSIAPRQLVRIWGGYIEACWHYFSVGLLFRTLLSPWRRDLTGYGRGFDFKRYLSVWSLNMVARLVGFVVRIFAITTALISEAVVFVLGFFILAFWLLAPLTLAYCIFYGLNQFLF